MSDELWEFIQPLLPPAAKEGRPRADDRRTIGAVLFVLKTGIPWNDLPDGYGDDVTAWRRLKEWEEKGVWKRIMDALVARGYSSGIVEMDSLSIDSDTIPAKKGELLLALTATRESSFPFMNTLLGCQASEKSDAHREPSGIA
jgi:transposase